MDSCQTYIVRIYRRKKKDPRMLVGVVEKAGVDTKTAFHSADELVGILTGQDPRAHGERRKGGRLRLKLPVTLKGTGARGNRFTEEAALEDISSSGAYLSVSNHIPTDKKLRLIIDPEHSGLDVTARVVRVKGGPNKSRIGVCFEKWR